MTYRSSVGGNDLSVFGRRNHFYIRVVYEYLWLPNNAFFNVKSVSANGERHVDVVPPSTTEFLDGPYLVGTESLPILLTLM